MTRLIVAVLLMVATSAWAGWYTMDVGGFLIMFELPDLTSFADLSGQNDTELPLLPAAETPEHFVTYAALAPSASAVVPEVNSAAFMLAGLLVWSGYATARGRRAQRA